MPNLTCRVASWSGRLAATFALLSSSIRSAAAQDLWISNARIVDPDRKSITQGNVLIKGGRIAGFPASRPSGFAGPTIDAAGGWVIPALTDLHTHSFGNTGPGGRVQRLGPDGTAKAALYAGVARYLDLFSPEDVILGLRDRQRSTGLPGAEILAAGPCLTATKGHCSEYGVPTRIVDSPADAKREVTALAAKHPDVVKVVYDHATYSSRSLPTIDRETLRAVVATATEHGLPTVVHIGTWDDFRDAVEAGARAVTHTPRPGVPPDDLVRLTVEHGTFHIPTLAVQSDYSRILDDPSILDSPLLRAVVDSAVVGSYRSAPTDERSKSWVEMQRSIAADNLKAIAKFAAAGVPMLTGTDAGNPAVFQGYSVHRELRLLVAAGLTPWQALAASTTNAGRFFKRPWGMKVGDEGTLLVLSASPIDDIANTEKIRTVIQRGRVVDRAQLLTGSDSGSGSGL
jgi:imidazolonepropionase-like amidohydrolase